MDTARVLSIQVGRPKVYRYEATGATTEWVSGIFKSAVEGPVWVGRTNLEGDGQADLAHHGGVDRAVLVYSSLHYPHWSHELGQPLSPGSFGENLTVDSLSEDDVCLGDQWESGQVRLEVSQPRLPCFKLGRRLESHEIVRSLTEAGHGGWYCRVLNEGPCQAGDRLTLLERPCPEWTVRRAFRTFLFERDDHEALAELRAVPALSDLWRGQIGSVLSTT